MTFTPTTGLINGAASWVMQQGGLFFIGFDGANWLRHLSFRVPCSTRR